MSSPAPPRTSSSTPARPAVGMAICNAVASIVFALCLAGPAAACWVAPDHQRPVESLRYDDAYDAWLATLSEELQRDPDAEIAYAGWLLDGVTLKDNPPPPPPPPPEMDPPPSKAPLVHLPEPASGLAHFMRYAYCRRSQRCDDGIATWVAADAGNLFPLERAISNFQRGKISGLERRMAEATRYDDYATARRGLVARIAARHDFTPPAKPPGYVLPPCMQPDAFGPGVELESRMGEAAFANVDGLAYASDINDDVRLHAADLMVAATGTADAAERGVRVGVSAARSVPDRERYCRLQARVAALDTALSRRMYLRDGVKADRQRLQAALATRNGIDAAEIFAREDGEVPPPLDEEKIAACVTSVGDEPNR